MPSAGFESWRRKSPPEGNAARNTRSRDARTEPPGDTLEIVIGDSSATVVALAREMCDVTRKLAGARLVVAREGNASVRIGDEELLCTPSGFRKGELTPDDLVRCDLEGHQTGGRHRMSSEIKVHLAIYEVRPDIQAIVHAHPVCATGFAAAGVDLCRHSLAEVLVDLGHIVTVGYHAPSTSELAAAVGEAAVESNAILLANHGALTMGRDLQNAFDRMETLERSAEIAVVTQVLGSEQQLSPEQVQHLLSRR